MPKPLKKRTTKRPQPKKKSTPRRPSDPNRAAHSLMAEHMRRMAEGEPPPAPEPVEAPTAALTPADIISEHMRKLGSKGGKISGAKRMENLSDRQRREIAKNAAVVRWNKSKKS